MMMMMMMIHKYRQENSFSPKASSFHNLGNKRSKRKKEQIGDFMIIWRINCKKLALRDNDVFSWITYYFDHPKNRYY